MLPMIIGIQYFLLSVTTISLLFWDEMARCPQNDGRAPFTDVTSCDRVYLRLWYIKNTLWQDSSMTGRGRRELLRDTANAVFLDLGAGYTGILFTL